MEFKDSIPMPPPSSGTPFHVMHSKVGTDFSNTQTPASPVRPDAARAVPAAPLAPPSSHTSSNAPPTATPDQSSMRTITAMPLASISPSYMSDFPTGIATHPGPHSSLQNSSLRGTDSVKKKRGRPRKYGSDGTVTITIKQFSPTSMSPLSLIQKRGRGRPPGSGKNQQLAALGELMCGTVGTGFTPHAITIAAGEDVAARIMSFSQQGPRGICILSANGAISNATLRQSAASGGTVTYEGRFEILSLSGSFLVTELCRTGGLSVSLAGPDGRVIGGGVAGMLMAASPVQVVVGSFVCLPKKTHTKALKAEDASKLSISPGGAAASNMRNSVAPPEVSVCERGNDKQDSPPTNNQTSGNATSSNDTPPGQMIAVQMGWLGSQESNRRITDINMSSPGQ